MEKGLSVESILGNLRPNTFAICYYLPEFFGAGDASSEPTSHPHDGYGDGLRQCIVVHPISQGSTGISHEEVIQVLWILEVDRVLCVTLDSESGAYNYALV